jgi:hypothetical protein
MLKVISLLLLLAPSGTPPPPTICATATTPPADALLEREALFSDLKSDNPIEIGGGRTRITDYNVAEPAPMLSEALAALRCSSQAVVVARLECAVSRLTPDRRLIYTENTFRVEESHLPGNPLLEPGQSFTLVRPGGSLVEAGKETFYKRSDYPALTPGKRYLLFLGARLKDNAYIQVGANGIFLVEGSTSIAIGPWLVMAHRQIAIETTMAAVNSLEACAPVRPSVIVDPRQ